MIGIGTNVEIDSTYASALCYEKKPQKKETVLRSPAQQTAMLGYTKPSM